MAPASSGTEGEATAEEAPVHLLQGEATISSATSPGMGIAARSILPVSSTGDALRGRLRELGEPIYGTKEELHARLVAAEHREDQRLQELAVLKERQEAMAAGQPARVPRTLAIPELPSETEIRLHHINHIPPKPWCWSCVVAKSVAKGHTLR